LCITPVVIRNINAPVPEGNAAIRATTRVDSRLCLKKTNINITVIIGWTMFFIKLTKPTSTLSFFNSLGLMEIKTPSDINAYGGAVWLIVMITLLRLHLILV
jgi:hypothetical protein